MRHQGGSRRQRQGLVAEVGGEGRDLEGIIVRATAADEFARQLVGGLLWVVRREFDASAADRQGRRPAGGDQDPAIGSGRRPQTMQVGGVRHPIEHHEPAQVGPAQPGAERLGGALRLGAVVLGGGRRGLGVAAYEHVRAGGVHPHHYVRRGVPQGTPGDVSGQLCLSRPGRAGEYVDRWGTIEQSDLGPSPELRGLRRDPPHQRRSHTATCVEAERGRPGGLRARHGGGVRRPAQLYEAKQLVRAPQAFGTLGLLQQDLETGLKGGFHPDARCGVSGRGLPHGSRGHVQTVAMIQFGPGVVPAEQPCGLISYERPLLGGGSFGDRGARRSRRGEGGVVKHVATPTPSSRSSGNAASIQAQWSLWVDPSPESASHAPARADKRGERVAGCSRTRRCRLRPARRSGCPSLWSGAGRRCWARSPC